MSSKSAVIVFPGMVSKERETMARWRLRGGRRGWAAAWVALCLVAGAAESPVAVTDAEMQAVYDEVKTPCKYGVVLAPDKSTRFTMLTLPKSSLFRLFSTSIVVRS